MILRGYYLVRPGHERAARLADFVSEWGRVMAWVTAIIAAIAANVCVHLFLIPAVTKPNEQWYVALTHQIWPFAIALIPLYMIGVYGGNAIDRWSARALEKHARNARPIRVWFGGMPDVPISQLWDVMDRYEKEGPAAFEGLPFT